MIMAGSMSNPSYAALKQALSQSRALSDPAEAHGTLTGALCTAPGYRLEDWLAEILPDGHAAAGAGGPLREVFDVTRRALDDQALSFQPVLPPDEESLDARTAALGEWCHGFLYGLGTGALPDLRDLQGEVAEILRDLTEITRVAVDARSGAEANENAYLELVEFVRMGVQILFEELRPLRAGPGEAVAARDAGPVLH